MLVKLSTLILAGLGLLQGAFSQQTTTLNIFPGDADAVENLQGEVLGVGPEGTTYAISGLVSGIQATATLVEGSTYLSEILVVETSGVTVLAKQACGLDENDSGLCTVVVSGGAGGVETAVTSVIPWTFTFAPVAIEITGTPDSGSSNSDSNSASAPARLIAFFVLAPILGVIATLW